MKYIYVIFSAAVMLFTSCNSSTQTEQADSETLQHVVPDSMPSDNTSVADSSNGNANLKMGGGN